MFSMHLTPSMQTLQPWKRGWVDDNGKNISEVFAYITECVEKIGVSLLDYGKLCEKLASAGFDGYDTYEYGNVGYLRDGTPVQFDFDPKFALANICR